MACTSCQVVILPHLKRWKCWLFPKKCGLEDFDWFGVVRVNHLYPAPMFYSWVERNNYCEVTQGHNHHGCSHNSNPYSDDSVMTQSSEHKSGALDCSAMAFHMTLELELTHFCMLLYLAACASDTCANGGLCYTGPEGTFYCSCQNNFIGTRCETEDTDVPITSKEQVFWHCLALHYLFKPLYFWRRRVTNQPILFRTETDMMVPWIFLYRASTMQSLNSCPVTLNSIWLQVNWRDKTRQLSDFVVWRSNCAENSTVYIIIVFTTQNHSAIIATDAFIFQRHLNPALFLSYGATPEMVQWFCWHDVFTWAFYCKLCDLNEGSREGKGGGGSWNIVNLIYCTLLLTKKKGRGCKPHLPLWPSLRDPCTKGLSISNLHSLFYKRLLRPLDFCSSDPCTNGGTCFTGQTSFVCICSSRFTGQLCQTAGKVMILYMYN